MKQIKLSLEQEMKLKVLENHVKNLSDEQVKKLLLRAVEIIMLKNSLINSMINHEMPLDLEESIHNLFISEQ